MYALDANTIIHAFQNKGKVAERLAATPPSSLAIPAIVLFEVEQGVLGSRDAARRRRQLTELVSLCKVLPFDARTASRAAELQLELGRQGLRIGPMDTLIAATAMTNGAILVTNNVREFERIPGLMVEDWYR